MQQSFKLCFERSGLLIERVATALNSYVTRSLSLSLVAPNKLEKQTNSREKEVTFIVIFIVSEFVFHFVICFSGCCETSVGIRILFFLCFTIMLLFYLYSFFSLSLSTANTLFICFVSFCSLNKKKKNQVTKFNIQSNNCGSLGTIRVLFSRRQREQAYLWGSEASRANVIRTRLQVYHFFKK